MLGATASSERSAQKRIGIYGWGVVAPGARDVAALRSRLLRSAAASGVCPNEQARRVRQRSLRGRRSGLPVRRRTRAWIAERHGETYCARLRSKMTRQRAVRRRRHDPGALAATRSSSRSIRELDDAVPRVHRLGRRRPAGELPGRRRRSPRRRACGTTSGPRRRTTARSRRYDRRRCADPGGRRPLRRRSIRPPCPSTAKSAPTRPGRRGTCSGPPHSPELATYLRDIW